MTVKELIKQLSEYPDDALVMYADCFGSSPITNVYDKSNDCVVLM